MFILLLSGKGLLAQSIVGTWKTISQLMVNEDGTQKDLMAIQTRQYACMKDLETIFEASGKQRMKAPANCKTPIDYEKMEASDWKMVGHTLSVTNKSMPTPLGTTATYTVQFSGNTAMLTHEYSPAEKQKLPGSVKVQKVVITYQRQ